MIDSLLDYACVVVGVVLCVFVFMCHDCIYVMYSALILCMCHCVFALVLLLILCVLFLCACCVCTSSFCIVCLFCV